ncbi:MAG TPA: hypothetical protein PK466_02940 [Thermotogota bacterium]|nr:hypothetical protein [Thermotogota bacterium]HPJ89434.1 hypothetical protein [Thermotogota bacterium]HPR95259.1 hypothetical protein [Thermotogota bacterium]
MKMKNKKRILIVMLVLGLFFSGVMLAGNGNGGGNSGNGYGDGTGTESQDGTGLGSGNGGSNGYGPGDGTGYSEDGPGDGTGYGPGDCEEIASTLNASKAYTLEEIAEAFGLQIQEFQQLINAGELKTIRSNNQLMIMGSEIQKNIEKIKQLY